MAVALEAKKTVHGKRVNTPPHPAKPPAKSPLQASGPWMPVGLVHLRIRLRRGFGAQLPLVAFALLLAVLGFAQGLPHLQRPRGLDGQLRRV